MSVDTSLRTLVLQNAVIVAVIGQRYHIDHIPDGAVYPCVRAVTVSDPPARVHSGSFGGRDTTQLDVYSDVQTTCDTAAEALIAWLDNYRGAMGGWNVTIQIKNRQGGFETDARLFRRLLEVEILYLNQV